MVHLIRLVCSFYAMSAVIWAYFKWKSANQPLERGGSPLNPFNDPDLAKCVYLREGSAVQHVCSIKGVKDILVAPGDIYKYAKTQRPWVAWTLFNALALACFLFDKWVGEDRGGQGSLRNPVVLGLCLLAFSIVFKPR